MSIVDFDMEYIQNRKRALKGKYFKSNRNASMHKIRK